MFKIGDFSRLAQVSTRMLRHYDQIDLLTPSFTDEWTGYRYYTIDQLPRLHRLIALKELGFSLEQVAALLRDDDLSPDQMRGMLRLRQAELQQEIAAGRQRLIDVEARLEQIEQVGRPPAYEVVVKSVGAQSIASVRQVVPEIEDMEVYCRTMYGSLYTRLAALGIQPLSPEITLYHTDEYRETDLDVEASIAVAEAVLQRPSPVDGLKFRELPAIDLAACLLYEGPFAGIETAILELLRWIGLHEHGVGGPLRELHLSGPAHVDGLPVATAVVELQLPVMRLRR
jgi:DNA-binding transcriptional MerR regulator